MGSPLNITNQERISAILGMLDFNQPATATILDAVVSPNQATPLQPGMIVKLDTSVTVPGVLQVVAAAASDIPFGMIVYNTRKNVNASEDQVKVAIPGTGGNPIIWHVANGSIALGQYLQYGGNSPISMAAVSTGKQIAQALDPAANGQLLRIALLSAAFAPQA
jgi:hypothetical protein